MVFTRNTVRYFAADLQRKVNHINYIDTLCNCVHYHQMIIARLIDARFHSIIIIHFIKHINDVKLIILIHKTY